jgi:hypothetical protein
MAKIVTYSKKVKKNINILYMFIFYRYKKQDNSQYQSLALKRDHMAPAKYTYVYNNKTINNVI